MTIESFVIGLQDVRWFENAGNPSEDYYVEKSVFSAWDYWNKNMLKVWNVHTKALEKKAINSLGDNRIDCIFDIVATTVSENVYNGFSQYMIRAHNDEESGLEQEITDFIVRDTAWACIEFLLEEPAFFQQVLFVNKKGRWACSWRGDYPNGHFVVL